MDVIIEKCGVYVFVLNLDLANQECFYVCALVSAIR